MHAYGDFGGAGHGGAEVCEVGGVAEGPGEEEEHGGGIFGFGGADSGEGAFEVVLLVVSGWDGGAMSH